MPPKRNTKNQVAPDDLRAAEDDRANQTGTNEKNRRQSFDEKRPENRRQSLEHKTHGNRLESFDPNNPENRRRSIDPDNVDHTKPKRKRGSIPHDEAAKEIAAAKLAEKMEKEREKQIQKGILQKEKEFQKKLAHHQQNDKDNSETSIYVAPPAPDNKISTVKLISCGVPGFRKCLMVCCGGLLLTVGLQVSLICCLFVWPMGFITVLQLVRIATPPIEVMISFVSVLNLIAALWLALVICFATKTRFCCWTSSTHWCIRGYYAYSVFLMILPTFAFLFNIIFIGRLDVDEMGNVMREHLNTYEAIDVSKEYWDETQTYLECCGIDESGWRDWKYRDRVEEDVDEWIVPESCCRDNLRRPVKLCE